MRPYQKKLILPILLIIILSIAKSYYFYKEDQIFEHTEKFKITKLYSDNKGDSVFEDVYLDTLNNKELGNYSNPIDINELFFRNSIEGKNFEFHNAPKKQYIIYLSGLTKIETSKRDVRSFKAGDILLVEDISGKGHKTTILENGRAIVLTLK